MDDHKQKLQNLTEEDFIELKKRYDEDFLSYWTAGNNPPKFKPISMEEFKKRLKKKSFHDKYGTL